MISCFWSLVRGIHPPRFSRVSAVSARRAKERERPGPRSASRVATRMDPGFSRPAVAAGHPATAEAGAEILEEGGTAADAAVAAGLASCVAETVMTGLLGGGHALHSDAASGRAENLDCFVAVPGLGSGEHDAAMTELE